MANIYVVMTISELCSLLMLKGAVMTAKRQFGIYPTSARACVCLCVCVCVCVVYVCVCVCVCVCVRVVLMASMTAMLLCARPQDSFFTM